MLCDHFYYHQKFFLLLQMKLCPHSMIKPFFLLSFTFFPAASSSQVLLPVSRLPEHAPEVEESDVLCPCVTHCLPPLS